MTDEYTPLSAWIENTEENSEAIIKRDVNALIQYELFGHTGKYRVAVVHTLNFEIKGDGHDITKFRYVAKNPTKQTNVPVNALDVQISGNHYKNKSIQPIEYIHGNGIGFAEGNVIKYVTRWRDKGGIADLEKAKHYIELLIQLETKGM